MTGTGGRTAIRRGRRGAPAPGEPWPGGRRRGRRVAGTATVWLLVLPGAAWAVVRAGGWERGPLVQLFAFTPYVAAGVWIPAVVAAFSRRWLAAAVGVLGGRRAGVGRGAAGDAGPPRRPHRRRGAAGDDRQHARGPRRPGNHRGPGPPARCDAAGAAGVHAGGAGRARRPPGWTTCCPTRRWLPRTARPAPRSTRGSRSRRPARAATAAASCRRTARSSRPAPPPLAVESAHPLAPVRGRRAARTGARDLAAPAAAPTPTARRGSCSATSTPRWTTQPLRALIAHGYRDAADADGAGLDRHLGPVRRRPDPAGHHRPRAGGPTDRRPGRAGARGCRAATTARSRRPGPARCA